MIRAGVIGWPVAHSLSPQLHGYWLEKYGITGRYDAIPIEPDKFEPSVRKLFDEGIAGFNVTLPFKSRIMPLLDDITPRADAIGAVNTVVAMQGGGILGDNTDAYGYIQSLNHQQPDWHNRVKNVCILGGGGAAKAIAYALLEENIPEISIYNRTLEKALNIIDHFKPLKTESQLYAYRDLDLEDDLGKCDLLINTTPLGMTGQHPLIIDLSPCSDHTIVSDIIYAPRKTDLLLQAEKRGLKTVEGLPMLLYQAVPGFEYWFNKHPEVDSGLIEMMQKAAAQ